MVSMNSIHVITVAASMLLHFTTECMAQDESNSTSTIDKKCFNPPTVDVDPMECCKIPSLLDFSLIYSCASKDYGNETNSQEPNEPPFATHIRVDNDF